MLQARLAAYQLLSQVFLDEPDPRWLRGLAQSRALRAFPLARANAEVEQGTALAAGYLEQPESLSEEGLDRLRWDYTRLFIGPARLPAPPWESAYLTEERLLFAEPTLAVRRAYLQYALVPRHFPHEADDHVGLELEFMARLAELSLERFGRSSRKRDPEAAGATAGAPYPQLLHDQQRFLREHLMRWIPRFTLDVEKAASTDFYRGMAMVLRGSLTVDRALLHELMDGQCAEVGRSHGTDA
ncbi:MAG: molecular chaperone TorD family protein [Limnochordaceae bacterium]|nr:molecular chaperone TorD family protein [Limnochordaceae bacterium]